MGRDNNNNMSRWLVRLLNHADVSSYMLSLAAAIKSLYVHPTVDIVHDHLNKHVSASLSVSEIKRKMSYVSALLENLERGRQQIRRRGERRDDGSTQSRWLSASQVVVGQTERTPSRCLGVFLTTPTNGPDNRNALVIH